MSECGADQCGEDGASPYVAHDETIPRTISLYTRCTTRDACNESNERRRLEMEGKTQEIRQRQRKTGRLILFFSFFFFFLFPLHSALRFPVPNSQFPWQRLSSGQGGRLAGPIRRLEIGYGVTRSIDGLTAFARTRIQKHGGHTER